MVAEFNPQTRHGFNPLPPHASPLWIYWLHLAEKCGGLPRKSDFSPSHLPGLITKNLLLLEYMPNKGIRLKLTGTLIDEYFGVNMTGQYIHIFRDEYSSQPLDEFMTQMKTGQYCGEIKRYLMHPSGRQFSLSLYYLPMANKTGEVAFLLGVAYPEQTIIGTTSAAPVLSVGSMSKSYIKSLKLIGLTSDSEPEIRIL